VGVTVISAINIATQTKYLRGVAVRGVAVEVKNLTGRLDKATGLSHVPRKIAAVHCVL